MDKKIENVLFWTAKSINPSPKGLEKILENLPVTNRGNYRYNNMMGLKFAIPIGIVILVAMFFISTGKKTPQSQTVTVLPATVTKENVDTSLNQLDSILSESEDKADQDLKELDQESSQQGSTDKTSQDGSSDDLNDL